MLRTFVLLLITGTALAQETPHSAPAIEFFSPQGTVKGVRQVTARFTEPMVPFGDPRLQDPFTIDCPAAGKGRWADDRNWVYDFSKDLPAGLRCSFTLKPDLKTVAGQTFPAPPAAYRFDTGGPAIIHSLPDDGHTIDEEQIFILGLGAPAKRETVEQHAWCEAKGVNERIGVRLLQGEERKQVLDQRKEFLDSYFHVLFKDDSEGLARVREKGSEREKFLTQADGADSSIVVVQCQRRSPNGAELRLVWGKDIATASGVSSAEDQSLNFIVREVFSAKLSCDRLYQESACIPILGINLNFTAPISRDYAGKIQLRDKAGKKFTVKIGDDDKSPFVTDLSFKGPFPERSELALTLPADLKDDAGRSLANQSAFPMTVRTDEDPPMVKFPAGFGIIELNAEATLPVTLRNLDLKPQLPPLPPPGTEILPQGEPITELPLIIDPEPPLELSWIERLMLREPPPHPSEVKGRKLRVTEPQQILEWLKRLQKSADTTNYYDEKKEQSHPISVPVFDASQKTEAFTVPKPNGFKAFEVVGLPLKSPGLHVVEIASPRLGAALMGRNTPYFVSTGALVTNLSVHFKHGRESSLVWVTTLDKGKPVANADVQVRDCEGKVYVEGRTDVQGLMPIAKTLPDDDSLPQCPSHQRGYFVTTRSGEDLSFAFSFWNEGISAWRFDLPTSGGGNPTMASTVFARTLLRAGETVHMKHFIRRHVREGIQHIEAADLPSRLVIQHQGSDQKYEQTLNFDANGIAESIWEIPKDAKQGVYKVQLWKGAERSRTSGSFRVEAYRVPTMQAIVKPVAASLVNADKTELDIQLNYLAGGGASNAKTKLRGLVERRSVNFSDYEGFNFVNGDIQEGEESEESADRPYDETDMDEQSKLLAVQNIQLDGAGAARATIADLPKRDHPQDLLAELEYQDANGEILTSATRIPMGPSKVIVGVKPDSWAISKDAVRLQAIVLDLQSKPIAGQKVQIDYFQRITYSHRKRLVGGFYAYEHHSEVKKLGKACSGKTDERGLLFCDTTAPADGDLILRAQTRDEAGNVSSANHEVWVAQSGDWWYSASDNDRMDLIPEKRRYEPSEKAVFQVRMPFREATALVTVEREGVMESFVREISGKEPIVEVPLKDNYAPNAYVSVLAVRGRANGVKPTATIDLGKPSFKLGMAEIKIGWKPHELKVNVAADRPIYKVREQAQIDVQVTRADGQPLPEGSEIALAAVDEGLLELMPNDSWNLLEAMMGRRPIEVETATAQMQVVGKRHYGRKARPEGGGGGKGAARELFDTLLLWQGRVKLDAAGKAHIAVPLNDSLTAFRIVAIANGGAHLFGTGRTSIRTTQDIMLFSALPPLVREQDQFHGGITVRNAADHPLDLILNAQLNQIFGLSPPKPVAANLAPITLALAPGEAKEIGWDVNTPMNLDVLQWEVTAVDKSGAQDSIRLKQNVIPAVRTRTFQATLFQIDKPKTLPIIKPADALPDRGGIRVHLRPRLAEELRGVREYMALYPYTCLEQKASQAVALRDKSRWEAVVAELPAYLDNDGLAKYFPRMNQGDDNLTAYLLAVAQEAGYAIPADALEKMKTALGNFVQGKLIRYGSLPTADLAIRKIGALEALSRYGKVEPAWLQSIEIRPNLWPTSAVLDWYSLLSRADNIPQRDERLKEAEQIVRSRLNFQGTTMGFSTERNDALWWLMVSGDSNANRVLLNFVNNKRWREDMGRLVRGALGRQHRGHWNTTVANAWGVLAFERFSQLFESIKVSGETSGQLETLRLRSGTAPRTGSGTASRTGSGTASQDGSETAPRIGSGTGSELLTDSFPERSRRAASEPGTATIAEANPGTVKTLSWDKAPEGGDLRFDWPAAPQSLNLTHKGPGKPWAAVHSLAAIPLKEPFSSGYHIKRTITPVEQKTQGQYTRGDVLRVQLELDAQSDMTWVVVNDPIPGGASILGTGLGRDSQIMTKGEKSEGYTWPVFEERTHDAFRAYYDYVPKGKWTVEYTVRLNNAGQFNLPETRVEALYAPEMFGEVPNRLVVISQ